MPSATNGRKVGSARTPSTANTAWRGRMANVLKAPGGKTRGLQLWLGPNTRIWPSGNRAESCPYLWRAPPGRSSTLRSSGAGADYPRPGRVESSPPCLLALVRTSSTAPPGQPHVPFSLYAHRPSILHCRVAGIATARQCTTPCQIASTALIRRDRRLERFGNGPLRFKHHLCKRLPCIVVFLLRHGNTA